MNILTLTLGEILYRKGNFFLSLASVAVAAAGVCGAFVFLRAYDLDTERIVASREAEVQRQTDSLQEYYRKIGTSIGFNILILPKDQNLSDLYANDYAASTMPQAYADTLARSGIITIQHLLPILQSKVLWPEQHRTIILAGTRGEVPLAGSTAKKPIQVDIKPGTVILGYELHALLRLKAGDRVRLLGRSFTVAQCYPQRGTKDDITAWINLGEAQQMQGKTGLINGILALECNCSMGKPDVVRKEIARILPQTQVIEFATQALARAESRARAAKYAQDALAAEKTHRETFRAEKERFFASVLPPLVMAFALWIAFLSWGNVRDRRSEIGVLQAIGISSVRISLIFLARAGLVGIVGALLGCTLTAGAIAARGPGIWAALSPAVVAGVLLAVPFLTMVSAIVPVQMGVSQDPVEVLRAR